MRLWFQKGNQQTVSVFDKESKSFDRGLDPVNELKPTSPYPTERIAEHINNITELANVKMRALFKSSGIRDRDTFVEAYKATVRPLLEHRSPVWNPNTLSDIYKLEMVQRVFTKSVIGKDGDRPYNERLATLGLETLKVRRLRADLVLAYKIACNIVDTNKHGFFTMASGVKTCEEKPALSVFAGPNLKKLVYAMRATKMWNELPKDKADFSSLDSFKNSLTSEILLPFTKFRFQ